jgi:ABC-2 type transport system ATP-binding protein
VASTLIETRDLTKRYGDMYAIRSIDIRLEEGDLFGFIGPNGAGKTTTMRILSTLLHPSWGEAYVGGHSIYTHPKEIRRIVGYMPDFFGVYDDMKVIEYLEFFAAAYRISGERRRKICDEMLQVVDLDFKRDAFANTLSRGQTQRLGLARVLLHDPQVLLLDEPLSGLDPRARIDMRNLLRRLGKMGKTIVVSSHILPELADVCNKIGIIDRGVMGVCGSVAEVMREIRQYIQLQVQVTNNGERAVDVLRSDPIVDAAELSEDRITVRLRPDVRDYSPLAARLVQAGFGLKTFREDELNLEAAFMALTKNLNKATAGNSDGLPANGPSTAPN